MRCGRRATEGRYSKELLTAALSRSDTPLGLTVTDGRTQDLVASGELQKLAKKPAAYFIEYRDGLKATMLMLDGAIKDFNFAARLKGMPQIQSTQFLLTPEPNVTYSACLMHKVGADVRKRRGAVSGGAHAAGQRHAGKLPDVEGSGPRAAGDAASECGLQGAAAIAVRAGLDVCTESELLPFATLAPFRRAADPAAVLESAYSRAISNSPPTRARNFGPPRHTSRRTTIIWVNRLPGPPTEIRSRWSGQYLYLLYICPYDELNLKPDPNPAAETPELWKWDVAEAFIGSDFEHIARYKEFQVSPQSEWVDLDIDRDNPKTQAGMAWNSGYTVKGRIDAPHKIWYGEMRIPIQGHRCAAAARGQGTAHRTVSHCRRRTRRRPSMRGALPWELHFTCPQAFGTLRLRKP